VLVEEIAVIKGRGMNIPTPSGGKTKGKSEFSKGLCREEKRPACPPSRTTEKPGSLKGFVLKKDDV